MGSPEEDLFGAEVLFKKSAVNIDGNKFKVLDEYLEDEARSTEEYEKYLDKLEDMPKLEEVTKRPTRTKMPRAGGEWG